MMSIYIRSSREQPAQTGPPGSRNALALKLLLRTSANVLTMYFNPVLMTKYKTAASRCRFFDKSRINKIKFNAVRRFFVYNSKKHISRRRITREVFEVSSTEE